MQETNLPVIEVIACFRLDGKPEGFPKLPDVTGYHQGNCTQCAAAIWVGEASEARARRMGHPLFCMVCVMSMAQSPLCEAVATRRMDENGEVGPMDWLR